MDSERGCGYWLWKPYIIKDALGRIADGEVLIYTDSGSYFVDDAHHLSELPMRYNQDVIPFELTGLESTWTKRDCFVLMNCEGRGFEKTRQRQATFVVLRKSEMSLEFVNRWLQFCCDERIVTDDANVCGFNNFPDFRENRHDQSVFSLLTKDFNLPAFRVPSQFENRHTGRFNNSNYPQIFEHSRGQYFQNSLGGILRTAARFVSRPLLASRLKI